MSLYTACHSLYITQPTIEQPTEEIPLPLPEREKDREKETSRGVTITDLVPDDGDKFNIDFDISDKFAIVDGKN